jgi:transcriptional regulator with XRE-family HTH domain
VAVSPSSSVQRAREQLAERLRDIRLDAKLNALQLSEAAGWHKAKTSRIESAKQAPSEDDIITWCRVCGAERAVPDLIAASRAADSMYTEWRRTQPGGLRRNQEARMPLFDRTRVLKAYCSAVIPGLLQTPEYAHALLSSISVFHGTPDDVSDAVTARMNRNRVLRGGNHRFALLVEEPVLRYRIGTAEVMAAQLGYLIDAAALPGVRLGVIPAAVMRPVWPLEAFTMFDDARVHVETLTAQITVTAPSEVVLYAKAFDELARLAVYGQGAVTAITAARADLT